MAKGVGGYAFGDSAAATRRLDDLAALHAPTTDAFLREHGPERPPLAIDLGCGPGHTTHLLATVLAPVRTVGVDSSPAYVGRAQQVYPDLEFLREDVTTPLPLPPARAVYGRFILAHLPEPERCVAGWAGLLDEGGTLLLEEGERMTTDVAACAEYLELVATMFAAEGRELFPGARLAGLDGGEGWRVTHSGTVELAVPARRYAALFLPNLAEWGPRAVAAGITDDRRLARLAAALEAVIAGSGNAPVVSAMRQVVVRRA